MGGKVCAQVSARGDTLRCSLRHITLKVWYAPTFRNLRHLVLVSVWFGWVWFR